MQKQVLESLILKAKQIRNNAHAPYSGFQVGCAVLLKDGDVITGVNVENASFPVGVCAERVALSQVVTLGKQKHITAIAVVADCDPICTPCGMCRQFILEIAPQAQIVLENLQGQKMLTNIAELLPKAFGNALLRKA